MSKLKKNQEDDSRSEFIINENLRKEREKKLTSNHDKKDEIKESDNTG